MKIHSILILAVIATCCTLARAQPLGQVDAEHLEKIQPLLLPEGIYFEDLDESTKEKYLELISKYFQYHISSYQHREKVFAWQHCSSQIIFAVVIILVFTAIYFSWLQFRQSLAPRRNKVAKQARKSASAEDTDDITTHEVGETQLEASIKGIKVSSPILGVIILVISLLFFYLYLVHVYPVTEIQ
ncbi:MAG: hypothetical protein ACYTFW_04500 [Planctomycetota bacterium]|jgi:hypothetical protein